MLNSGTSYDFYLETDLDAFDEPVDYSSKYQERYSYKDNGTINLKGGNEKTTADVKQMNNESENTKSTPLSISPASSFCDLQNIVDSVQSLVCNEESSEEIVKNCAEAHAINISYTPEKDGVSKGSLKGKSSKEKSVTFGRSSVSETPLMFSRSSSVDSLSSFEQQSIFDDRSYVSALSTPASGVLSPSELPASPSELMSPGLLKTKSAFQFPIPKGNSSRNLPSSINFKLKEHENDADLLSNGVFDDTPKMFSDEGKSSATSSLSSLSFYDGSVRVSVSISDQKAGENVPSVDAPNDEDPSYAFADTKKEYKYEGQTTASNDRDDCYYQLNLNSTLGTVEEHEHIELSSFVFEDTKNCYDDEGKFSTTSSLSSISFLDHGDHVPEVFQTAHCSSLNNNNVLHPDNPDVVCSSSLKGPQDFKSHEKIEPNLSATLVSKSLQPSEVCEDDSASEVSDYDSEQERKDKELIDQLLTNSLQVSKSGSMHSQSESSESEYDSEQERKDQELIDKLLAQSLPAQVPKSKCLPTNQKPDLKSCSPKDRTHAPSKIFTSRGRETSSKQGDRFEKQQIHNGLKCSPVEVFDESSESDYDSEQERQDQELISKLLTTTMPLQVPKRNILDDHQSAQMSRSHLPKYIKDVSPNYACKTLRATHQQQDYGNGQPNKGQLDNQFSQVQVSDESSDSDYDREQEMKDQELINNLLQPTMSLPGSRQQNHLAEHQKANASKSCISKDMKVASPKHFAYREPRNHMPQYRGELPFQSHCNQHCSHAQGYRDSVPDGSSDVNEKSDKLLLKLSNARKADKTLRHAKQIRQSYPVRAKQGCQIHKAPTPKSNSCDKKQYAQYNFAGRMDSVARHPTYSNVAEQPIDPQWSSNSSFVEINDSARVYIYRTEESPIITRSPSLSDLNTRPCPDDKSNHDRFLKNSRK